MRRWLAILLLALLPFQFSWAAVGTYCGYESDAQGQHLGHHEHQRAGHAGVDKTGDPAGKDASTGNDVDCGQCHGSCCFVPSLAGALMTLPIASYSVTPAESMLRTLAQNPPERPQWLRLA
jgi:hypothetical protein